MTETQQMPPERLRELLEQHAHFEYERDLHATMATVAADCVWEFHPLGLRAEGLDAVRVVYEYEFAHIFPNIVSTKARLEAFGDQGMLREIYMRIRRPDGREADGLCAVTMEFDAEGLITSERSYGSGAAADLFEFCFTDDIWSVPGVTRLYA